MKTTLAACCAAAITTIGLAAQTPAPKPTTQPQPRPKAEQPAMREAAHTMTVTGCLKTWDEVMKAGTPAETQSQAGAARPASAAPRYVLTDVTHDAMPGTDSAQAKQNPYGSSAVSREQTMAVVAKDTSLNLSAHLNHKVQLTGSLDAKGKGQPQQSSTGTSGSTGTATTGRSTSAIPMTVPTFNVTALKMISTSCS